jgi:hypothetical protein
MTPATFPTRRLHAEALWRLRAVAEELRHEDQAHELLAFVEVEITKRKAILDTQRRGRAAA